MKKKHFIATFILTAVFALLCAPFGASVTALAADYTPATVEMDKTYIERSIVSETPVDLTADVRNASRQRIWDAEVSYTVTTGESAVEIKDGDKLYVKAAGEYTIRAEVVGNTSVYEEFSGVAYDVTFSNVEINNVFENVTVYAQPVKLVGDINIVGMIAPTDCHYELVFRVVSGPAEIYCKNYLKITGTGEVTIEAASRYDADVKATKTFTVTDPDANKIASEDMELMQGTLTSGCSAALGGFSFGIVALALCAWGVSRSKKD